MGISITVPKLWALLKTFIEDLPQFIIQMIYLFTNKENDNNEVYIPIIFSIMSLMASVVTAKTANTSGIDINDVALKLEERH
jgi:hypothetical protein